MDIKGFIKHYSGLSELTRRAYEHTLIMLERKIAGDEPTDEDVRHFLKKIKVGTTLQRHKAAIKRYYLHIKRPWLFDSKEFVPARKRLPRYLRRDQVNHLIDCAENEHERMFVKTLFITGIRIGELRSLTRDSVEPDGIRFVGKRDKESFVPIVDREFIEELTSYAAKHQDKLFPDKYFDYWLMMRRLCLKAGFGYYSPHTLRHSRAVDLESRGIAQGAVQTFLRHEQASTTLIYTQLVQRDLKKELERIENKEMA